MSNTITNKDVKRIQKDSNRTTYIVGEDMRVVVLNNRQWDRFSQKTITWTSYIIHHQPIGSSEVFMYENSNGGIRKAIANINNGFTAPNTYKTTRTIPK